MGIWTVKVGNTSLYTYKNSIWLANIPIITPSTINRQHYDIYKHDGGMVEKVYYRSSASVELTFHSNNYDYMHQIISRLFVSSVLDGGEVDFILRQYTNSAPDFETGYRYTAINAEVTSYERRKDNYGRMTVKYEILPQSFLIEDNTEIILPATVSNTDDLCKPLYDIVIAGNTTATIKVGNKTPFAITNPVNLEREYRIDSRKMLTIYQGDHTSAETSVTGDYENLWVGHGSVAISVTNAEWCAVFLRRGFYI